MSCLQTLVALSSGAAEYCALIRGACTSLGIQPHYQDWLIDVSSSRSVARRRGSGGRRRHLQTRHLWLQSRTAFGHLRLHVVAGEQNPADVLTKTTAKRQNSRLVRTCWSKMVAAIITTTNDGEDREGWQTRCSAVRGQPQTDQDLWKAFSSYSSLSSCSTCRNG